MTFQEIAACVASSYSVTRIANAFRIAVGLPTVTVLHKPVVRLQQFDAIEECFKNHGSPMDGIYGQD